MLLMKQKMFFGVSNVVSEKALTAIRHKFFFGGRVKFSYSPSFNNQGHPMTVFRKISVWGSKNALNFL